MKEKFIKKLSVLAIKVAIKAGNSASCYGFNQPIEPEALKKLIK